MLLLEVEEEEGKVEDEDEGRGQGRRRRHAGAGAGAGAVQSRCSPGCRCKSAQPEWEREWDGKLGMEMRWDGHGDGHV